MLKQISRLERTRRYLILGFAVLMGLSLIFFYAPRRDANASPVTSREAVAVVDGDEITVGQLSRAKEFFLNQMSMFGSQAGIRQLGGYKRLLDNMIESRVVAQEAERLGLAASDAEVADQIRETFTPAGGKFDFARYRENVASQFGGVEQYEDEVRRSIAEQKLRAYVTAGVQVSDEELQRDYVRDNTSFDLVYVAVRAADLAKKINPSEEEARQHFDAHKEEFRFNEAQKKIRYLYIDQEKVGQKLNITDQELREEFNQLKPENKQAGVRVQQIVLRVPRPEDDPRVLEEATKLVQGIRDEKSLTAPEDKFAELARGKSEDPATAKNGGWLPNLVKKKTSAAAAPPAGDGPEDLLQNTLTMQPGQVGDPVKTGNAYYIFRRGDAVEKTFEQAKNDLLVSLRNRKSYRAADEVARRAAEQLKESKDVQKVAESLARDANMSPSEMVRETPFVKPGDDVPNIGSAPQFEEAIAPLNNPGDVGDRVGVKGGFAVPLLVERRDPRIPEFEEVRDKVIERVRQERAGSQLEQTARQLAESAGSPDALKAAAERLGLKAETMPSYRVGTPLGEAGTSPALEDAVYNLKAGEVARAPVKVEDEWLVFGATKRTDADLVEFGKQREQLRERALNERRSQIFDDHVAAARARYEREEKIKVYDEVVKRLEDDEPAVTPPTGVPGLPPVIPAGG